MNGCRSDGIDCPGFDICRIGANPESLAMNSRLPLDGRAAALMTLLCLLWSLQQISMKAAAPEIAPMMMIALRSGLAALLLGALMARRGELPQLASGRWKPGLLAGALFALEYVLVSEALAYTQAAHVLVFLYTSPIFAALGLHLRLREERLAPLQWGGIGLAFLGIAVAFLDPGAGLEMDAQVLLGDAMALLAGASWGATTVVIRCSRLSSAPATETLLYQLLGAFVLLPLAWAGGRDHFAPGAAGWGHLLFQSVIVSFASFLAWCWLLRRYLASRLGVFSFLTPLLGVLLGAVLLGEMPSHGFLLGGVMVLAGIGLVSAHGLAGEWLAARTAAPALAGPGKRMSESDKP